MNAAGALKVLVEKGSITELHASELAPKLQAMNDANLPLLAGRMIPMCDIPLTLQRRIIHAVDGVRMGQAVYVVFDRDQPYEVVLVTPDIDQVFECLDSPPERISNSLFYSGLYLSPREYEGRDLPTCFLLDCHGLDSDPCWLVRVTDETLSPRMTGQRGSDVDAIKVSWRRTDADVGDWEEQVFAWGQRPVDVDGVYPDENRSAVDAVFFSMAALDKFVFPYLARVHGHKMAFERRERLRKAILDGHVPGVVDLRDKGLGEADLVVGT